MSYDVPRFIPPTSSHPSKLFGKGKQENKDSTFSNVVRPRGCPSHGIRSLQPHGEEKRKETTSTNSTGRFDNQRKVRAAKDSLGQPRTLAGDFKTRDARHKKPGTVEYNLEVLRRMEITQRGYGYRSNVGGFVPLVDGGIDPEGFQTEEMLINPEATGPKPPPVSKKSSTEEFRRVARRGMSRDPWGSFFTRPGQEPNTALDMHTTLRSLSGGNPGSGKSAKTLEEIKVASRLGYKRNFDGRVFPLGDQYR
eukprot:jgi/Bigna1/68241/fgenesh1_pg.5_\